MQGTADFHHHVAHPLFPHPDGLFQHAAAFDTAIDMFDAHPSPRDRSIALFLLHCQLLPAWLLRRLDDVHAIQRERLKAQVLQQVTPRRQRIRRRVGDAFVMDASRMGLTQKQNAHRGVDQQEVFQHMPLFLTAIARFLFSGILGARDGALGAVMTKRGAPLGAAVGGSSDSEDANSEDASDRGGTSTPSRWRKASNVRQGASPKARRVLRNTGSNT